MASCFSSKHQYFYKPKASANTACECNNIAIFHDECNKWFILYVIYLQ